MRIAFLTPEFVTEPTFYGGIARHLGRLAPLLVGRGHDVEVFVPAQNGGRVVHEGVVVHRLPLRTRWYVEYPLAAGSRLGLWRLPGTRSALAKACALDHGLRERAREVKFDVVEAASWMAVGYYAVRRPVAPVVVFAASFEPTLFATMGVPMTLDKRLWCRLEDEAMKRAAAVYAPSRFLATLISEHTGIPVKVITLPYCPDPTPEEVSILSKVADWPRYLLYFGKMCSYKGCGILAEAVEPLLERVPDLRLVLVGAEPTDEAGQKLTALADRRPERVRYMGLLKPAQIRPLIRRASGVVLPSLMDNLPNTCLEAMGAGQVVVGPDGVSFDELIEDGTSGILFKLGDAEALREAILRVWGLSDEERRRIGEAAKARLTLLSPEQTLVKLENFYRSVTSGGGHRADLVVGAKGDFPNGLCH